MLRFCVSCGEVPISNKHDVFGYLNASPSMYGYHAPLKNRFKNPRSRVVSYKVVHVLLIWIVIRTLYVISCGHLCQEKLIR